jgi:hypothetical protein
MSSLRAEPASRAACPAVGTEQRATGSGGGVVLRIRDHGEWFEPGMRVDYFYPSAHARRRKLEKAALGSYEVEECKRVETNGRCWLHVKLRLLLYADPVPARGRRSGSSAS